MERRSLIPHQVDWFTIFQYPPFIKYEHSVTIVSGVLEGDSLVHDSSETMGNDKHGSTCKAFFNSLCNLGIHSKSQQRSRW
jgi:hypothetical protein